MTTEGPKVRCRDITGKDCDRIVSIYASDCGIAGHDLPQQPDKMAPGPSSIYAGPHKPRLTVDEDYDLVFEDLADDEVPTLEPGKLFISRKAQNTFTTHHQVLPEVAVSEIRLLASAALAGGVVTVTKSKVIVLEIAAFRLRVSPDGRTVTEYFTFHFERTPSQVLSGKPSRFGGTRGEPISREPHDALPIDEMRTRLVPQSVRVSNLALSQYSKWTNMDKRQPETLVSLRRDLEVANTEGTWATGRDDQAHELTARSRKWIVASDGTQVILCVPVERA